ncbi:putative conserved fungal protein [Sesbania bispinosa]|nr:putative conserved fungal protein [Sesbania bispinosa]
MSATSKRRCTNAGHPHAALLRASSSRVAMEWVLQLLQYHELQHSNDETETSINWDDHGGPSHETPSGSLSSSQ